MNNVICPACGSAMNYNTAGKQKNPKSADYKCTNVNCKCTYDRASKQMVTGGQYITGLYESQLKEMGVAVPNAPAQPVAQPAPAKTATPAGATDWDAVNAKKELGMKQLNALNNACLLVAHGKVELKDLQEIANKIFSVIPVEFKATPAPVQPTQPVETTVENDPNEIDVSSVPF